MDRRLPLLLPLHHTHSGQPMSIGITLRQAGTIENSPALPHESFGRYEDQAVGMLNWSLDHVSPLIDMYPGETSLSVKYTVLGGRYHVTSTV
jgi:hypothetical protein